MTIKQRISGPLLAPIFIRGGYDAFQNPDGKVKEAEVVTKPLVGRFPALPDDTATLVRLNGAVQVGAAVLLGLGTFRRLAALALMGSLVPTTLAGHRFWDEVDADVRAQQQMQFCKNAGLLAGLFLVVTEPPARHRRNAQRVRTGAVRKTERLLTA
jgi:putative oxidoreductase